MKFPRRTARSINSPACCARAHEGPARLGALAQSVRAADSNPWEGGAGLSPAAGRRSPRRAVLVPVSRPAALGQGLRHPRSVATVRGSIAVARSWSGRHEMVLRDRTDRRRGQRRRGQRARGPPPAHRRRRERAGAQRSARRASEERPAGTGPCRVLRLDHLGSLRPDDRVDLDNAIEHRILHRPSQHGTRELPVRGDSCCRPPPCSYGDQWREGATGPLVPIAGRCGRCGAPPSRRDRCAGCGPGGRVPQGGRGAGAGGSRRGGVGRRRSARPGVGGGGGGGGWWAVVMGGGGGGLLGRCRVAGAGPGGGGSGRLPGRWGGAVPAGGQGGRGGARVVGGGGFGGRCCVRGEGRRGGPRRRLVAVGAERESGEVWCLTQSRDVSGCGICNRGQPERRGPGEAGRGAARTGGGFGGAGRGSSHRGQRRRGGGPE